VTRDRKITLVIMHGFGALLTLFMVVAALGRYTQTGDLGAVGLALPPLLIWAVWSLVDNFAQRQADAARAVYTGLDFKSFGHNHQVVHALRTAAYHAVRSEYHRATTAVYLTSVPLFLLAAALWPLCAFQALTFATVNLGIGIMNRFIRV
jgi:hypothetical protein